MTLEELKACIKCGESKPFDKFGRITGPKVAGSRGALGVVLHTKQSGERITPKQQGLTAGSGRLRTQKLSTNQHKHTSRPIERSLECWPNAGENPTQRKGLNTARLTGTSSPKRRPQDDC